jgi:hypothetical protein
MIPIAKHQRTVSEISFNRSQRTCAWNGDEVVENQGKTSQEVTFFRQDGSHSKGWFTKSANSKIIEKIWPVETLQYMRSCALLMNNQVHQLIMNFLERYRLILMITWCHKAT